MPATRRSTTRPLLKIVNGRPHATEDDHESSDALNAESLPTPPDSARNSRSRRKSGARQPAAEANSDDETQQTVKGNQVEDEEDPERDPVSSDDEADDMAGGKANGAGGTSGFRKVTKPFEPEEQSSSGNVAKWKPMKTPSVMDHGSSPVKKAQFKTPAISSDSITAPKREMTDAELDDGEEDEPQFMQSSQPKKKRKHNPNVHTTSVMVRKTTYGSQNEKKERLQLEQKRKQEERQGIKRLSTVSLEPTQKAPVFKRANLGNLPAIQSMHTVSGADDDARQPEASPSPEPDSLSIVCETCNERMDKLLKEEYSDTYVRGNTWNIQWQERFCEWHRALSAKEIWIQRGYPTIDWTGLERRMRQHDDFLLSVLRGETASHYRDEYAAKVKAKSMSSGFKDAAVKPGATVGYYGPKGEKSMEEHILSELSDEIRERAKTDKLVSPSGYQGGISGFVQGVLVPHLAELLIKDDMQLTRDGWTERVRATIAESAEVGELLQSDVRDRNHEVDAGDDWMLQ